jgi:hypothetical protein
MMMRPIFATLMALSFLSASAAPAAVRKIPLPFAMEYLNDFELRANEAGITFDSGVLVNTCEIASCPLNSGVQGLRSSTSPGRLGATITETYRSILFWFGNDDPCCSGPFDVRLTVFANGVELGSVVERANMNDLADQYLGLYSETPIDRFEIDYGGAPLFVFIDDLSLSQSGIVPEPASWAMMIAGFGATGVAVRRRRDRVRVASAAMRQNL